MLNDIICLVTKKTALHLIENFLICSKMFLKLKTVLQIFSKFYPIYFRDYKKFSFNIFLNISSKFKYPTDNSKYLQNYLTTNGVPEGKEAEKSSIFECLRISESHLVRNFILKSLP